MSQSKLGVNSTAQPVEMPHVDVVMLTIADDDTLFEAIKNGAKGYLLKNLEPQELYGLLDKLRQGERAGPLPRYGSQNSLGITVPGQ